MGMLINENYEPIKRPEPTLAEKLHASFWLYTFLVVSVAFSAGYAVAASEAASLVLEK